jgi:uncharacterized membrane protein YqgA involved in biofilm formation
VIFSILVVLVYQGGLSLAAGFFQEALTDVMLAEMTVVGGILLLALAVGTLLEIRSTRPTNLLPALLLAPVLVLVIRAIGL